MPAAANIKPIPGRKSFSAGQAPVDTCDIAHYDASPLNRVEHPAKFDQDYDEFVGSSRDSDYGPNA